MSACSIQCRGTGWMTTAETVVFVWDAKNEECGFIHGVALFTALPLSLDFVELGIWKLPY